MSDASSEDQEIFSKINDYTLSVVVDFGRMDRADPELRRLFNFKARNVTTLYSMWYGSGVSTAMETQNFSALDSLEEVAFMREKLLALGGNPPALEAPCPHHAKPKLGRPPQG